MFDYVGKCFHTYIANYSSGSSTHSRSERQYRRARNCQYLAYHSPTRKVISLLALRVSTEEEIATRMDNGNPTGILAVSRASDWQRLISYKRDAQLCSESDSERSARVSTRPL
jgi:hypothetical protein